MPSGVGLAVVEVLCLDDLVDGLVLADGLERCEFEGGGDEDLSVRQAANFDGSAAISSHGILHNNE